MPASTATFTLYRAWSAGIVDAACAWRDWLVRAVAGMPSQVQPLYGLGGERHVTEIELPWLPGYEGAAPVRIGNAAHGHLQLDVFGELMDALDRSESGVDGLPLSEGCFLLCTFWLADNRALLGRHDDATRLFERRTGISNDVGLLAEEDDASRRRFLGNFPQGFSHIALINSARNRMGSGGPGEDRRGRGK